MTSHSNPCEIIKIDKQTNKIVLPDILLETRSGKVLGKIGKYDNFNASLVGVGIDEVSFDVHKYVDGKECPIWDKLVDLKIIELRGYGKFQIKVSYTDNTETVKAIIGQSLEVELGQLPLREFHVNDEDNMDYDENDNLIPTVFYNPNDTDHSLLHRVLKDKAPHWSIGHVPTYVSMSEDDEAESVNKFQRTYTEDGTSIYDFLTGTVAEETNVVFIFDTFNRIINCYSLIDCYITKNGQRVIVESAIGEDTLVFASKKKLLNEVSIDSNQEEVKNCFRVEGGDDTITAMIAAVNMNGTNYIWKFSDFQLEDMSAELQQAIKEYQNKMSSQKVKDEYYGENGIYTQICKAYEELYKKESTLMPSLTTIEIGEAKTQYEKVVQGLTGSVVYVPNIKNYPNGVSVGVNNKVEEYATIFMDSRFKIEINKDFTSYYYNSSTNTGTWRGKIKITQRTDESNTFPIDVSTSADITITIGDGSTIDGEIEFMRQKVQKALAKSDMANLDFDFTESDSEIRRYFDQFSLNRLKSFYDAYNECISILAELISTNNSQIAKDLYNDYYRVLRILKSPEQDRKNNIFGVLDIRETEVEDIKIQISTLEDKQRIFQEQHDFQTFLEGKGENLYKEFCMYRREDIYTNSNYTSDNLETVTEQLNKAKELMDVADAELSKACVLQRTVSTSLSNLLILPEFESLYDSFALFNYIRVQTDDEILKLRLIGVEFNGDSIEEINVTFSEKIETVDGKVSDTESILQQASAIATSYSSTAKQAKQGESANKEFIDIYTHGLTATKTMLSNNDNNEVTMTGAGLIAKRMDDEGYYGDKQLRITGNGMYLTEDSWKSLSMAVGEIIYTNPITGEQEDAYGIICDSLIGNLMASKQTYVSNENGSVLITGEGITIKNGLIQSANYEENVSGSMLDLTNGTFNYAGGNLTYNTTDGLVVKGKVTATTLTATNSGKIANFNISSSSLYTDGATYANTTGLYFGSSGLRIGSGFKVNSSGNITSSGTLSLAGGKLTYDTTNGLSIEGKITATSGTFTGTISGSTISGGTITIGDSFKVTNTGILTAKSANITGNINATKIKADNAYYICDGDFDTYIKVISSSSDDSSDTKFNFGRLTNNDYGSGLNYISFADSSQDRLCTIYSDYINIKGYTDISGDFYCSGNITLKTLDGTSGRYAIGSWSTDGYWVSDFGVNSNGDLRVMCQTGVAGSALGMHTLLTNVSDMRVKKNINNCSVNALKTINKIKLREFDWDGLKNNKHQEIGFVADELEQVDNNLTNGGGYDERGNMNFKSIDSLYLQGYEVKAIQELSAICDEQQNTITEQQSEIDFLKESVSFLIKQIKEIKGEN